MDRDRNYLWKDLIVKQNNSILFHVETVILFFFFKKIDWNEVGEERGNEAPIRRILFSYKKNMVIQKKNSNIIQKRKENIVFTVGFH